MLHKPLPLSKLQLRRLERTIGYKPHINVAIYMNLQLDGNHVQCRLFMGDLSPPNCAM